jgi:hypothetical protein
MRLSDSNATFSYQVLFLVEILLRLPWMFVPEPHLKDQRATHGFGTSVLYFWGDLST